MPSWQATCFSSAWWGGSGGFTYLVSNCGDDSEGKARCGRTVRAALGGAPLSLRGTGRHVWQRGRTGTVTEARHHHALPQPYGSSGRGSWFIRARLGFLPKRRSIRKKKRASFLRAVPSAVPFQGLIDGGTKHVVVGIPPPPSRCPIHPTLSFPLLYLPPNNPKSPLTRFLLPI